MTDLERGVEQIQFARRYTLRLVESIPHGEWYLFPPGGVTHVAWEVGHIAMAEYRLLMDRFRNRRPEDEALIGDAFLDRFCRESVPVTDPAQSPSPDEIRAVMDRVHAAALAELATYTDADLNAPGTKPHALCRTRRDYLFWCPAHEMLHAGRIGLLRRQLGHPPQW